MGETQGPLIFPTLVELNNKPPKRSPPHSDVTCRRLQGCHPSSCHILPVQGAMEPCAKAQLKPSSSGDFCLLTICWWDLAECGWDLAEYGWDLAECGWDLAEWLERLTANAVVATVLGSIPASSDTVESEGRQMKQCWISYIKRKIQKNPPSNYLLISLIISSVSSCMMPAPKSLFLSFHLSL